MCLWCGWTILSISANTFFFVMMMMMVMFVMVVAMVVMMAFMVGRFCFFLVF